MNKTVSVLLLIILMGALGQFNAFGSVRANVSVQSRTIYVGPNGNFTTISAAVANATAGDTIIVANGTYREQVLINKSLSLVGQNRNNTIIDAGGANYAVQITASNVTLSGFTLRNQTTDPTQGPGGLWLNGVSTVVSNVTIANCTVINSMFAVWFSFASNNTFRENDFVNNSYDFGFTGELPRYFVEDMDTSNRVDGKPVYWLFKKNGFTVPSDAGVVIAVNSTNITVKDLAFNRNGRSVFFTNTNSSVVENVSTSGSLFGIWLEYSFNDTIRDNTVFNSSLEYGISLTESDGNLVIGNNVSRSGFDLKLVTSHYNRIIGNILSNSTDIYGLMLDRGCLHNYISDNIIRYNTWAGIGFDDSSNYNVVTRNLIEYNTGYTGGFELSDASNYNLITENTFKQNSYGITSSSSDQPGVSVNDMIYKNNFLNNTVQVANLAVPYNLFSTWDNGAEGNYWSNFTGIDANLNGIIDSPYNVSAYVSLFTRYFNTDHYPLMEPWSQNRTYQVTVGNTTFDVIMQSNSTIGGFTFNQSQKYIAFNVTGPAGAKGFCNVTIPKLLLNVTVISQWMVMIDDNPTAPVFQDNPTNTTFYLTYGFTTHQIRIKGTNAYPEFPFPFVLVLLLVLATLSVAVLRRKCVKGIGSNP